MILGCGNGRYNQVLKTVTLSEFRDLNEADTVVNQ